MKLSFLIFSVLVITSLCGFIHKENRVLSQKTLQKIKSSAIWNPYELHENPLNKFSRTQIKAMLGVELMYTKETKQKLLTIVHNDDHSETFDVPLSFDSRQHWPDCIGQIRKQEHCGSCWAFSASTTLADRFCIASEGKIKTVFSPQYMVSCNSSNKGCNGGLLDKAWEFLEETGITKETCNPYVSGDGKMLPSCMKECVKSSKENFELYKVKKQSSKPLTCALQMQRELLENGPVQTGFEVYEDFLHYKNGIYKYTDGIIMGGHAVKIVGWGQENGINYWIVANSWGPEWGENGLMRICREEYPSLEFGTCNIKMQVVLPIKN